MAAFQSRCQLCNNAEATVVCTGCRAFQQLCDGCAADRHQFLHHVLKVFRPTTPSNQLRQLQVPSSPPNKRARIMIIEKLLEGMSPRAAPFHTAQLEVMSFRQLETLAHQKSDDADDQSKVSTLTLTCTRGFMQPARRQYCMQRQHACVHVRLS